MRTNKIDSWVRMDQSTSFSSVQRKIEVAMELEKLVSWNHVQEVGEALISGEVIKFKKDIKRIILLLNAPIPRYLWLLHTLGKN